MIYTATVNGGTPDDGFQIPIDITEIDLKDGYYFRSAYGDSNGNIYLLDYLGRMLKKNTNSDMFSLIHTISDTSTAWAITCDINNNIYYGTSSSDDDQGNLYKSTDGGSNFVSLNKPGEWTALGNAPNGDIYAENKVEVGNPIIYKMLSGSTDLSIVTGSNSTQCWITRGMAIGINNLDIYITSSVFENENKQALYIFNQTTHSYNLFLPEKTLISNIVRKGNDMFFYSNAYSEIGLYKQTNCTGNFVKQAMGTVPDFISADHVMAFDDKGYLFLFKSEKIYKSSIPIE